VEACDWLLPIPSRRTPSHVTIAGGFTVCRLLAFFTNMFFFKGTVLPAILPQIILATVIATGTYWLWREKIYNGMPVSGHTAFAGLVSTLLVFRNNLSHAR
jgi:predicted membrane chloride channel (bestrophin family)